jgi:hypothetical protein
MAKRKESRFTLYNFVKLYKKDENKAIKYLKENIKEVDKIYWKAIAWHPKLLSERFMEEFKNKLNWEYLCEYQNMPLSFLIKHKDKINLNLLNENTFIKQDIYKKFLDYLKLVE